MKGCKKFISILGSCALMIVIFTITSFASNIPSEFNNEMATNKNAIAFKATNVIEQKTDKGYEISFDLIQEADTKGTIATRAIGWVQAGDGKVKLDLAPANGIGFFDWYFSLSNGDLITSVKSTMLVEKDLIGPVNPNYAKVDIYRSYKKGTQYNKAQDSHAFSFPGNVSYNQNIIFRWTVFTVQGVQHTYYMPSGSKQGKVCDFI
ncbi:MAG: hypothetical protein RR012_03130 [Oscillospiraceae bacterium]